MKNAVCHINIILSQIHETRSSLHITRMKTNSSRVDVISWVIPSQIHLRKRVLKVTKPFILDHLPSAETPRSCKG